MSKFTKLKTLDGNRVQVDLTKVSHFEEAGEGTVLYVNDESVIEVQEGFQTVSNRVKAAFGDAE